MINLLNKYIKVLILFSYLNCKTDNFIIIKKLEKKQYIFKILKVIDL